MTPRNPDPALPIPRALLILGLLISAGCGALRRPDPPIDRSQDPRILREVRDRLAAEPSLDVDAIRVEVDGAIVVLYGSVRGIGAWQCAIRTTQMVVGVTTVIDYLVIERGDRDVECRAPRSSAFHGPQPAAPVDGAGGLLVSVAAPPAMRTTLDPIDRRRP